MTSERLSITLPHMTAAVLSANSSGVIYMLTPTVVYKSSATTAEHVLADLMRKHPCTAIVSFPIECMDGVLPSLRGGLCVEYCSGGDLLDHLMTCGPMTMTNVRLLGRTLLRAMAHLKQLGYAHCDIKPENVFICAADAGQMQFKLGDMGAASPMNGSNPLGCALTLGYGAPEALGPEKATDEVGSIHTAVAVPRYDLLAADIWALGMTLTAAASGSMPWEMARHSDSYFNAWAMSSLSDRSRADILGLAPECGALAPVLITMLAIMPEARPSIDALLKHPLFCL